MLLEAWGSLRRLPTSLLFDDDIFARRGWLPSLRIRIYSPYRRVTRRASSFAAAIIDGIALFRG